MDNKTVFDVNIWISYFLKGRFTELVDLMANHDVEYFRAKELTEELISVISRDKFKKIPAFTITVLYLVLREHQHPLNHQKRVFRLPRPQRQLFV